MMTTARVLVCCFGLVQLATAAGAAIKDHAGRTRDRSSDADQPRFRMADRGRRQPQCRGRSVVPPKPERVQWKQGLAAAAAAGRAHLSDRRRVRCRLAQHVRRQHPRSGAGHRLRSAVRAVRSGWHRRADRQRRRSRPLPFAPGRSRSPSRADASFTCIRPTIPGPKSSRRSTR